MTPNCPRSDRPATNNESAATMIDASDHLHAMRDDSRACFEYSSKARSCFSRKSFCSLSDSRRIKNHSDSSTVAGTKSSRGCESNIGLDETKRGGSGSIAFEKTESNHFEKPFSSIVLTLSKISLPVSVLSLTCAVYGAATGNAVASILSAASAIFVVALNVPILMDKKER